MTRLSKAQRARLDKLATYLEGLPKRYRHFGMRSYVDSNNKSALVKYARENGGVHQCGTAACALGHGPAAGILAPLRIVRIFEQNELFSAWRAWEEYAQLFGVGVPGDPLFEWCFGGHWEGIDNTHHGAAARIRYLLAGEGVASNFGSHEGRPFVPLYAPYRVDAKQPA